MEFDGAFGVHAEVFEGGLLFEVLFPEEGEGIESLAGGSDGEVGFEEFVGIEAVGGGVVRGVEGEAGDFFAVDIDGGTLSDFEVQLGVEGAE